MNKQIHFESINLNSNTIKYTALLENATLSMKEAFTLLYKDSNFALKLSKTLENCKFISFFFEMPPLDSSNIDKPFEFVIINSPQLANKQANPSSFLEYMIKGKKVVSFENVNKDAILIIPCKTKDLNFVDMKRFLVNANKKHIISFWKVIGKKVLEVLKDSHFQKIWCSTSGLGVSWLHFRIDSIPKYYKYLPYKK
jgi:hypothetical protein